MLVLSFFKFEFSQYGHAFAWYTFLSIREIKVFLKGLTIYYSIFWSQN